MLGIVLKHWALPVDKCEVRDVRYSVAMRGKADAANIAYL
jgi:hypothetical protein